MTAVVVFLSLFVLAVIAIVGGVIAIFVVAARQRRRRAEEMGTWAGARGWTVVATDPTVAGLACPPVEHGGRSRHVARGCDGAGHPVVAFEWSYRVSSSAGSGTVGDSASVSGSHEVLTTVVATTLPGTHALIQVSPGRPRTPGLLRWGRPDPRTRHTGVPAFDARATLLADDPAHAARVLPPAVLAWWAADPRSADLGFRLSGSWAVCWQSGGVGLDRLDRGLGFLADLRDVVARSQITA